MPCLLSSVNRAKCVLIPPIQSTVASIVTSILELRRRARSDSMLDWSHGCSNGHSDIRDRQPETRLMLGIEMCGAWQAVKTTKIRAW